MEPKNTPFAAKQIADWKQENKGKRAFLPNALPNRAKRRADSRPEQRAIMNNRRNPARREAVYHKMAHFYLSVQKKMFPNSIAPL